MKVFITGASGFIGSNLTDYLLGKGHQVMAIGRSKSPNRVSQKNYRYISADTTQSGEWQNAIAGASAVVNLAGASIFKRWSEGYKRQIYDSRILTTRNAVAAIGKDKPVYPLQCFGCRVLR
jgi:uncharacterized protein